jgi:hypothetical protein
VSLRRTASVVLVDVEVLAVTVADAIGADEG